MKKVYILLMHTNTLPSKFIKLFTRYSYTHVGISLDEDCNTIYSFGRKTLYSFLNGGFVIEGKTGAFLEKFHEIRFAVKAKFCHALNADLLCIVCIYIGQNSLDLARVFFIKGEGTAAYSVISRWMIWYR